MGDDQTDALKISPMVVNLMNLEQSRRKKAQEREEALAEEAAKDSVVVVAPAPRSVRLLKPAIEEECYATDYPRRGLCILLEQDAFHPGLHLSERAGSDADRAAAQRCFADLGFDVRVKRNLRLSDISRLLQEVAELDHSPHDCLAIVMLSHGNEGTVYAFDGAFPTQRLWEPFTADRCPSLAGKPKLVFLQACQGARMDAGVRVARATATDDAGFASYKVPVHADFLVAHSTVAGFYSWRNTAAGSWYVQCLCRVLDAESRHRDVVSALTLVQHKVTHEFESSSSRREFNGKKQTPFLFSTLTKKLYLSPKGNFTK